MISEMPQGLEPGILEQIRKSNTRIRTRITTVYVCRVSLPDVAIVPRGIGTDQGGWEVGEAKIPVTSLEDGIIVAMEILSRG